MRLLNTGTFEFKDFYDDSIPAYAILSHRWREDEVSYQEFLAHRKRDNAGFSKIVKACELAASESAKNGDNYGSWIWIDTCCINKESSSELSEAINSMWRWYQNAAICYAYLDDVPEKPFQRSEWFTRGWTLQELLAPSKVEFYSKSWLRVGNKIELCDLISTVTGIKRHIILGGKASRISGCSAAEKLSWAANRRTSRVEDTAYCLLGLLDINMPLLYGEGIKAFARLQEELVRASDDESILAWSSLSEKCDAFTMSPVGHFEVGTMARQPQGIYPFLFADTPTRFASCEEVLRDFSFGHREPFQMTNRGLRMDAVLIPLPGVKDEFVAPLNCGITSYTKYFPEAPLALHVALVDQEQNLYNRKGCVDLARPEFAVVRASLRWERPWAEGPFDQNPLIRRHRFPVTLTSKFTLCFTVPLIICILLWAPWSWCAVAVMVSIAVILPLWNYMAVAKRRTIFISKSPLLSFRGDEVRAVGRLYPD